MAAMSNRRTWLRRLGLGVGFIWVSLWTIFIAASAWGEGFGPLTSEAVTASVILTLGVLALWIGLAIAWRREVTGGALMLIAGHATMMGYTLAAAGRVTAAGITVIVLTLGAPPLVAGLMLLVSGRLARKARNSRGLTASSEDNRRQD